jgi:hypothetical protein
LAVLAPDLADLALALRALRWLLDLHVVIEGPRAVRVLAPAAVPAVPERAAVTQFLDENLKRVAVRGLGFLFEHVGELPVA